MLQVIIILLDKKKSFERISLQAKEVVYHRGTTSVSEDMHATFLCDGVYCGPHYKVAIGKLHYTYVHKDIFRTQSYVLLDGGWPVDLVVKGLHGHNFRFQLVPKSVGDHHIGSTFKNTKLPDNMNSKLSACQQSVMK